jgi:probable HAF family extracellular repeat protein
LDINDSGQVVGTAMTASGEHHAFRTAPNQPINLDTDDIGTLGDLSSFASGINDGGQVVGAALTASGEFHAFVHRGAGPMQDLNELIDPTLGWVLYDARGINDLGQIVGTGNHNGDIRAFLLTPIPEPASIVLALVGVSSLALCQRRRSP